MSVDVPTLPCFPPPSNNSGSRRGLIRRPLETLALEFSAAFKPALRKVVAALLTKDGIFVAVDGHIYHGRAETRASLQTSIERGTNGHAVDVTETRPLGESVYAIGDVRFRFLQRMERGWTSEGAEL